MARKGEVTSESGRLAVAAGLKPGTTAYVSFQRNIQRSTTTTGTETRSGAKQRAALPEAEKQRLQAAQDRAKFERAVNAANKVSFRGKIDIGSATRYEAARAKQDRTVTASLSGGGNKELFLASPIGFWNLQFFGNARGGGSGGNGIVSMEGSHTLGRGSTRYPYAAIWSEDIADQ